MTDSEMAELAQSVCHPEPVTDKDGNDVTPEECKCVAFIDTPMARNVVCADPKKYGTEAKCKDAKGFKTYWCGKVDTPPAPISVEGKCTGSHADCVKHVTESNCKAGRQCTWTPGTCSGVAGCEAHTKAINCIMGSQCQWSEVPRSSSASAATLSDAELKTVEEDVQMVQDDLVNLGLLTGDLGKSNNSHNKKKKDM